MEIQKQVAYKIWISSILGKEVKKEEDNFSVPFIEFDNKKISKVNIIASVVGKFINDEKNFASVTLDDGSGVIRIKVWKEDTSKLENVNLGDIINVIGRPRVYNEESYIIPEIVKKIDNPNFELLRKLELFRLYGKPNTNGIKYEERIAIIEKINSDESEVVEEIVRSEHSENNRQYVIKLIELFDKGEGTNIQELENNSKIDKHQIKSIITDLLREGEIFEIREGYVKLIG